VFDVEKSASPLLRHFMKKDMVTLREQRLEKPRGCPADASWCSQTQGLQGPKLVPCSKHRGNWKTQLLQDQQLVQAVGKKGLARETGPAPPLLCPFPHPCVYLLLHPLQGNVQAAIEQSLCCMTLSFILWTALQLQLVSVAFFIETQM